jgi:carbohydrate esterase-like sialic acid-specific acetylesterase
MRTIWRRSRRAATPVSAEPTPRPRPLLVVAGQSNATGYLSDAVDPSTNVDYFSPPYSNGADKQSTIAWDQSSVVPARTRCPVPLGTPQLRLGSEQVQIFGPEIGLARTVFADTGRAVTVVKAAHGGTPIAAWKPSARKGLFQRLVSLVRTTMSQDRSSGWLDTIGGLYWYQGEFDARSASLAAEYQENLVTLISGFRSNLPLSPTTPIVLVKQSTPHRPGDAAVRDAADWAAAHLPHVLVVDTLGLSRTGDGLHLTNTAELELGRRLAVATRELMV